MLVTCRCKRVQLMITEPITQPYVELRRAEVFRRALELWQSAGRPNARSLQFWLQALVELLEDCRCRLESRLEPNPESAERLPNPALPLGPRRRIRVKKLVGEKKECLP